MKFLFYLFFFLYVVLEKNRTGCPGGPVVVLCFLKSCRSFNMYRDLKPVSVHFNFQNGSHFAVFPPFLSLSVGEEEKKKKKSSGGDGEKGQNQKVVRSLSRGGEKGQNQKKRPCLMKFKWTKATFFIRLFLWKNWTQISRKGLIYTEKTEYFFPFKKLIGFMQYFLKR